MSMFSIFIQYSFENYSPKQRDKKKKSKISKLEEKLNITSYRWHDNIKNPKDSTHKNIETNNVTKS